MAAAFSFLNILEIVPIKKPEEILIGVVSGFQSICSGVIHNQMCEVLLKWNFASSESKLRCFQNIDQITFSSVNRRYIDYSTSLCFRNLNTLFL